MKTSEGNKKGKLINFTDAIKSNRVLLNKAE